MGWITKEDGQHIYIGSGGEFQPRGPTAATAGGKPKAGGAANRAGAKGPGGMARTASGINLHERMTASATAASTRAAAARARGDRPAELAAHEHRALILAKQNDVKGVHKSQFGYARTAPGSEKTAAAALVARVRGGGKAAAPAAPAQPAGIGPKPGESFSLAQRSATRSSPSAVNVGRGTTKFMFDMNRKDKPGQTSMFDKLEAKTGSAAAVTSKPAANRERTASIIAEARAGGAAPVPQRSKPAVTVKPHDYKQMTSEEKVKFHMAAKTRVAATKPGRLF